MDRHIGQGEFSSQSSNTVTYTKGGLEWSGPSTPTDKWVLFFLCGIKILATTGLLMTSQLVVVCVCVCVWSAPAILQFIYCAKENMEVWRRYKYLKSWRIGVNGALVSLLELWKTTKPFFTPKWDVKMTIGCFRWNDMKPHITLSTSNTRVFFKVFSSWSFFKGKE